MRQAILNGFNKYSGAVQVQDMGSRSAFKSLKLQKDFNSRTPTKNMLFHNGGHANMHRKPEARTEPTYASIIWPCRTASKKLVYRYRSSCEGSSKQAKLCCSRFVLLHSEYVNNSHTHGLADSYGARLHYKLLRRRTK